MERSPNTVQPAKGKPMGRMDLCFGKLTGAGELKRRTGRVTGRGGLQLGKGQTAQMSYGGDGRHGFGTSTP